MDTLKLNSGGRVVITGTSTNTATMSNIQTIAATTIIVGVAGVNISLIKMYPELMHVIVMVSPLVIGLLLWILEKALDTKDAQEDSDDEKEDADSTEYMPFEGITYEMDVMDLYDLIFERLREKMYGKNTTVNAEEIRDVFMAAYNVSKGDSITMDAIECIIDMVIYCIEIMEEAGSSAAAESPTEPEPEPTETPEEPSAPATEEPVQPSVL